MNRFTSYFFLLVTPVLFLTSCNTFSGIGKDLSTLGGTMTNTAERTYIGSPQTQKPVQQTATYRR